MFAQIKAQLSALNNIWMNGDLLSILLANVND
jgi:hypothetical protein